MKHTLILPCLGLLSLASFAAAQDAADTTTTDDSAVVAQDGSDASDLPPGAEDLISATAVVADAATVKPGTVSTVTYQATFTNQAANGGTAAHLTFSMVTSRWGNKDILTYMAAVHDHTKDATQQNPVLPSNATAYLPDKTVVGWSIVRLADKDNTGNLYAVKKGQAAVAVPTFLLTAPVVTGVAYSGSATATNSNFSAKAYGTLTVNNGPATASGTQTIKIAPTKIAGTVYSLTTRSDNFTVIGQAPLNAGATVGPGTINSSFHMAAGTPTDLGVTLLPGAATP